MRAPSLFLGMAIGGAIVALVMMLRPPGPPAEEGDGPARLAVPTAVDLEPVMRRLDAIERRLVELAPRAGGLPASVPGRLTGMPGEAPSAEAGEAPAALDVSTLADAMEEVELRRLDGLSVEQLRQEARSLMNPSRSPGRAQQILQRLLERDLEPAVESEVLTQLGMIQRSSGDLAGAEATLRKALDLTGIDSPSGVGAAGQLAWTLAKREDWSGALRVTEDVLGSEAASDAMVTNARWALGVLSQGAGDDRRARAEYERFLHDFASDPQYAKLVADVRRRMESLP